MLWLVFDDFQLNSFEFAGCEKVVKFADILGGFWEWNAYLIRPIFLIWRSNALLPVSKDSAFCSRKLNLFSFAEPYTIGSDNQNVIIKLKLPFLERSLGGFDTTSSMIGAGTGADRYCFFHFEFFGTNSGSLGVAGVSSLLDQEEYE